MFELLLHLVPQLLIRICWRVERRAEGNYEVESISVQHLSALHGVGFILTASSFLQERDKAVTFCLLIHRDTTATSQERP